jgi:hypothetical protein
MRWRSLQPARSAAHFEGQVLFADVRAPVVVVDCMVARRGSPSGPRPATLVLRLPHRARPAASCARVLRTWAADGVAVGLSPQDGRRGEKLVMRGPGRRIRLYQYTGPVSNRQSPSEFWEPFDDRPARRRPPLVHVIEQQVRMVISRRRPGPGEGARS